MRPIVPMSDMFLTQPMGQEVMEGGTATFFVVVKGPSPISYQWYYSSGSVIVPIYSIVNNTQFTSTLTIQPVSLSNAGNYYCTIYSTEGGDGPPSSMATLVVDPSPFQQPLGCIIPQQE